MNREGIISFAIIGQAVMSFDVEKGLNVCDPIGIIVNWVWVADQVAD